MNATGRLVAFGAGLTVAFAAAYVTAATVVPSTGAPSQQDPHANAPADAAAAATPAVSTSPAELSGLSLAQGGYALSPVRAPGVPGERGTLRFTIANSAGKPLLDYATVHDKQVHLIVVRTDGQYFAHVHPVLDKTIGTWSTPWTWDAAGTYRVFADFQPAQAGSAKLTLTRAVEVAGEFTPVQAMTARTVDEVAGYTVKLDGALAAGASQQLTAEVTRDGRPVTLQPYLGAFGHLVALRDGDLAYLHVHPDGAESAPGRTGGPTVSFAATTPTEGRYLLYLDFKVDDTVHTATFVLDAARGHSTPLPTESTPHGEHDGGH